MAFEPDREMRWMPKSKLIGNLIQGSVLRGQPLLGSLRSLQVDPEASRPNCKDSSSGLA
jgi:hypothetical protein